MEEKSFCCVESTKRSKHEVIQTDRWLLELTGFGIDMLLMSSYVLWYHKELTRKEISIKTGLLDCELTACYEYWWEWVCCRIMIQGLLLALKQTEKRHGVGNSTEVFNSFWLIDQVKKKTPTLMCICVSVTFFFSMNTQLIGFISYVICNCKQLTISRWIYKQFSGWNGARIYIFIIKNPLWSVHLLSHHKHTRVLSEADQDPRFEVPSVQLLWFAQRINCKPHCLGKHISFNQTKWLGVKAPEKSALQNRIQLFGWAPNV